jgi:hypothetical protein
MYAHVTNGVVDRTGGLPTSWTLKDGRSVSGFNNLTAAEQLAEGWLPLTENMPALGAGQQYGPPTYTVGASSVTADYPVQATPAVAQNADALRVAAKQAIADNKAFVATTPSAAQVAAQVKALSRQQNGLIRLLLGQLDATD